MPITQSDINDAIEHLNDNLELVILRGSEARWRARRGLFVRIDVEKAKALVDELKDSYQIRTGVNPPRRVLTPETVTGEERTQLLASGWVRLRKLAERAEISRQSLNDAIDDDRLRAKKKKMESKNGSMRPTIVIRADADLARYLASRHIEGAIESVSGKTMHLKDHRRAVVLDQPSYTYVDLADIFDLTRHTISTYLCDYDIPTETGEEGRHNLLTGPELARALEEQWPINVTIDL